MNTTARIARWSADHWKTVFFGWLALVVALFVLAGHFGTNEMSMVDEMSGQSKVGEQMIRDAGLVADGSEVVLITSPDHAADSPAAAAMAKRVAAAVQGMDGVEAVQWDEDALISADGKARAVNIDLTEHGTTTLSEIVAPIRTKIEQLDQARDGFRLQQFGDASINDDVGALVGKDLAESETLTAPITIGILLITFGALVAAGLPLLVGMLSVSGAIRLGALLSHLMPQSEFAPNLVSMLGIALGIDYTLFLLRREREERAAGATPRQALLRAAATSGTAVVISGITVIVALSGLLVSGSGMFVSMGVSSMLVVAMVLLASLLVVPALLGKLGDRVEKGRLPRFGKRRLKPRAKRGAGSRVDRAWGRVVGLAVRRPLATIAVVGALLLVAAMPVLDMRTGDSTTDSLPKSEPSLQALADYEAHFPGGAEPARVVLRDDAGTLSTATRDAAIDDLVAQAKRSGATEGAPTITTSEDGRTTQLSIPLAGGESREASDRAITKLRSEVDETLGALPHTTVAVTGSAAESFDFAELLSDHMPLVFLVVLGSAFVLLALAFRSIVVPLVAILLNLLSVGVAYGFLVWGFQHANLDGIIDVAGSGVVVSWMPLFLFALLFGLSMDYHVFMISRIREGVDAGFSTRDAVVRGVRSSASTITSAAFIMVGVFAAFGMSQLAEMQQMGWGLAVAILLDATIIRALLLPAIMTLLGDANWYLPSWLGWLPKVHVEGREQPAAKPALETA